MSNIVTHSARNLKTDYRPPGQRLTLHYIINNKVLCEAEVHLTADVRFIALPIPVLHQMTRGVMK